MKLRCADEALTKQVVVKAHARSQHAGEQWRSFILEWRLSSVGESRLMTVFLYMEHKREREEGEEGGVHGCPGYYISGPRRIERAWIHMKESYKQT